VQFVAGARGRSVGLAVPEGEPGGRHHPERRVRSVRVVVAAPVLDEHRASARQENSSTDSSSSRTLEPKLSTYGFCHGEPGSMYALVTSRSVV
jgi:hypothetical protein